MSKPLLLVAALAAAAAGALPVTASAAVHGHVVSRQGAFGRGYVHSRSVSRQPGAASVTRSTQTNRGYGATTQRNATWGDGAYQSGRTTTFNNGQTITSNRSLQANGDGTATYQASRTGVNGATYSYTGTVSRPPAP